MRQVFQRKTATGAFGNGNECFGNRVVLVASEPALPAGQHLQLAPLVAADGAFCRRSGAALMMGAELRIAVAGLESSLAAEAVAVAGCGNVGDAEVNADPVFRIEAFGFRHVANTDQEPLAAHEGQISLALAEFECSLLPLAGDERNLDSTAKRPDREQVASEGEQPLVIGLGSETAEARSGLAVDLESIGHLGDRTYRDLRGEIKTRPGLSVSQLVQIELAQFAGFEPRSSNPVTSLVAALKRRLKRLRLVLGRLEFYACHQLHAFIYRRGWSFVNSRRQRFLPALKDGVSTLKIR